MKPLITYAKLCETVGAPVVAVVTSVGIHNGLAVLRGLGRMGVPVYAVSEKNSIGFYSRYVCKSWVVPDNHHDPEGFLEVLLEVGRELKTEGKKAVLFATRDSTVELFAKNAERLEKYFVCHFPSSEVIYTVSDKMIQYRTAERIGVPYPQTYFEDELEQLYSDLVSGKLQFPVICKTRKELPSTLRKKFRIAVFETKEGLQKHVAEATSLGIHWVVQNVVPGGDENLYTLGSCIGRDGRMKAVFTGRKLLQQPPKFGICRVGESMEVPELIAHGEKLLRELNFFGISQVEFKYDHRDGKYKLMEVNPRSWAWISLPIEMGINLPYAFFCDALGIDVPLQEMKKRAVWISATDDLYWSLKARDAKPWGAFFKGYEQIVEAYFVTHDMRPGMIHFGRFGRDTIRSAFRYLLRKVGLKQ